MLWRALSEDMPGPKWAGLFRNIGPTIDFGERHIDGL